MAYSTDALAALQALKSRDYHSRYGTPDEQDEGFESYSGPVGTPDSPGGMTLPPGDPFWGDSYASQQNRRSVQAEDTQDIVLRSLREAAEQQRRMTAEDARAEAADFSQYGMDRSMEQANVANQVGDVTSEAEAGREFLPNAMRKRAQDQASAESMAQIRYLLPEQVRGDAAVDAQRARAGGQIGAAQVAREPLDPMDALYEALMKRVGSPETQYSDSLPEVMGNAGLGTEDQPETLAALAERVRAQRALRPRR